MSTAIVVAALMVGSHPARLSAAPAKAIVLTGTVTEIFQANAPPPSMEAWAVTIRVEKVKAGKYEEPTFTFTIHSPARAGLEVGHRYTIEATWNGHKYAVKETSPIKKEDAGP
ncbi:MAG TPA: hypothetical protein VIL10_07045 [Marmoricola sp.]